MFSLEHETLRLNANGSTSAYSQASSAQKEGESLHEAKRAILRELIQVMSSVALGY